MTFSETWEISVMELENSVGKKYKVTRKYSDQSISETKIFRKKSDAKQQLEQWMAECPLSYPQED